MGAENPPLIVPRAIEDIIAKFDKAEALFNEHDVSKELRAARQSLTDLSPAENSGVWSEILAFSLTNDASSYSPWGTYFGPTGSMRNDDGTVAHFPDIAGTPAIVIEHWATRANTLQNLVLKARYADLAWEMSRAIANISGDHKMAQAAIDAYLEGVGDVRRDIYDHFQAAIRALDLAETLRDTERIEAARKSLLQLHANALSAKKGLWWKAFDRLIGDRKAGMNPQEEAQLVADMEAALARLSDFSEPDAFDPHLTKNAADRLIRYYNRAKKTQEKTRLNKVVAVSFEHAASLGDPLLASAFLQTAVTAYRDAGLAEDSKRVRVLMEDQIEASHAQMKPQAFEMRIPQEKMDQFLDTVVTDKVGSTFARLASAFLHGRERIEEQLEKQLKDSPLSAMIAQTIMADRHVAAVIGSIEDDPFGRVIQHAARMISMDDVWLLNALDRASEVHSLTPHHFVSWVAQSGLFKDLSLLFEGFSAWFVGDFVKVIHVLLPQLETGLRAIAEKLGRPITKAHPRIKGASVAINIGDVLSMKEVADAIGRDTTLHLLALYSDPRGFNLRNDMAHGLMEADAMNVAVAARVLHSFLVLGVWDQIAKARKPGSE